MRVLIFSDIHGNDVAFQAMLADIGDMQFDQMVCLGDVAQGGQEPAEVLDRLQALGCPVVMGNSDLFLLDIDAVDESAEPISDRQRAVRDWSLGQLEERHLAFMQSFQPRIEVALKGDGSLLCFHGSPNSFDHVILPETSDEEFERMVDGRWATLMTGGHVHLQWLRRHGDSQFFNPGSVGLAYDHDQPEADVRFDPWAEYAVVTSEAGRLRIEFRRAGFDPREVVASIERSGMPHADHYARPWRRS